MSKKRPKQQEKAIEPVQELKPRGFVPRQCSNCAATRPANVSFVRVYCTRGKIRYCKCDRCNFTWSQYFDNCTTCIVHTHENILTQETSTPSLDHGDISIVTGTSRSSD